MSRGKSVQGGVRVKLRNGMTWEKLAQMTPDEIRDQDVFPRGFMPLPIRTIRKAGCSSRSSTLTR